MKASRWARLVSVLALSKSISAYGITGISGGVNADTGERPSRLDLRTLQSAGPAFDLFIQALSQWQSDDQSDILSYYEIAGQFSIISRIRYHAQAHTHYAYLTGIHGYPYRSWDDVNGQFETGYCSHGSPIFPTWHRPYVALVEERIWSYAQSIASSYPDDQRQSYVDAATTLRFPYWDWATNSAMPESLTYQDIVINTPTGQQSMTNPLYSYKFHPLPLGSDIPYDDPVGVFLLVFIFKSILADTLQLAKYQETVRSPDPSTGESRMDNVNSGMSSNSAW
jgi:tyrosinase